MPLLASFSHPNSNSMVFLIQKLFVYLVCIIINKHQKSKKVPRLLLYNGPKVGII